MFRTWTWNRESDKKVEEIGEHASEVIASATQAKYERDVAHTRLATIQAIASANIETDPHPYREHPKRLVDGMVEIYEAAQIGLKEGYREAGCFITLSEARTFLQGLEPDSDPIIMPVHMWDGECFHIIYTVPSISEDESPPEGADMRA